MKLLGSKTACLLFAMMSACVAQAAGGKPVIIDKTDQMLRAYEGGKLVFQTRISTGKRGKETPDGHYHAESKSRMHYSRLYKNAPMPYSVEFSGNYFIHGFSSVPDVPASHGCIRLPLDGGNPARWFYNWVDTGTPILVTGQWPGRRPRGLRQETIMPAVPLMPERRGSRISRNP